MVWSRDIGIGRTDLYSGERRKEVGTGGTAAAEKRTTRRRRNAVRSHIGSDTGNPEAAAATPQILPSCWTSCSLHNRIRMNRPSRPLLLVNVLLLRRFLCLSLSLSSLAGVPLHPSPSSPCRVTPSHCAPPSPFSPAFFLGTLPAPTSSFPFTPPCRFSLHPTPSALPRSLPPARATLGCLSRFFLSYVVAEAFRRRPRTEPPRVPPPRPCSIVSRPPPLPLCLFSPGDRPFRRPSLNLAGTDPRRLPALLNLASPLHPRPLHCRVQVA